MAVKLGCDFLSLRIFLKKNFWYLKEKQRKYKTVKLLSIVVLREEPEQGYQKLSAFFVYPQNFVLAPMEKEGAVLEAETTCLPSPRGRFLN